MENDAEPPPDHKLCGYLCAVLTVPADASSSIPLNSLCSIGGDPPNVYFATQNDVRLTPMGKPESSDSNATPSVKKKWSRIGMVHGSISVVHQLHALVTHKCLRIVARITRILPHRAEVECGSREVRAVVLVDVYLPIDLWSGWQFPRSSSIAAALFKHLSCDWEARSLMLKSVKLDGDDYYSIWNVTDCHVLGCRRHCSAPDNLKKKKLFELQEIFKSLPCVTKKVDYDDSRVKPAASSCESGIWVLSDDILINILTTLSPIDLVRISLACRHLRFLAASIMPCMKLKLYPHQQAAVEWMLQREKEYKVLKHPLFMNFRTEDGFDFNINMVSGEIVAGIIPTIRDFRGGMFCDEPGLGKTITAISLILKTQGTLAEPPDAVQVIWCMHDGNQRCGYYEARADKVTKGNMSSFKNILGHKTRRGQLCLDELTPKKICSSYDSKSPWPLGSREQIVESTDSCSNKRMKLCEPACSTPATISMQSTRSWSNARRNLLAAYKETSSTSQRCSKNRKQASKGDKQRSPGNQVGLDRGISFTRKRDKETVTDDLEYNETWVQCDACSKWRKVADGCAANTSRAWFCSMNSDPSYQSCNVPEESWDCREPITYLPGFHAKGSSGGQEENISFFIGVLKDHYTLLNSETKKALTWLAKLSPGKLAEMETIGLVSPIVGTSLFDTRVARDYHKIFQAFGLKKRVEKGVLRWYYPKSLVNLAFDLDSLRIALCTPTPNTPNSQLSYLQPMLKFLKEETYGQHQKSWEAGILRPFEAEMEEGRSRLLQLLNRCMISARKIDLKAIPPCIKKITFVDFSEEHAKSYNELVETVRRNILMADWNDSSHVESLLNPKQWKFRATTIKNVRLSCCVAGHVRVTDAGQDIQETMDILVDNGLDPASEEYAFIKYSLLHGGNCMRCREWCRLPVITPCRHLLCLDCVALDSERCTFPGCGNSYEMQSPEELARPENPNPKWPVPKDLIELQPSYKQDDWNPDWQSTSSSKVTYLVRRLKELQEMNRTIVYGDKREFISNELNFSSNRSSFHISLDQEACDKARNEWSHVPSEKVIIFSQFLEHIHVIEQQLSIAGIQFAGMYSPMHSSNKMKSLATFQHDANCMALLMDGSAALGLDLSFVTHVYLMEPIWDRSMEEQVISRAHRMGAARPIHVETLAMTGTIEEQMLKFLQDGDECRRLLKEEFGTNGLDGTRSFRTLHDFAESNYLTHLSFVRNDRTAG
ncbi:UNVERIFIED_CONTAM: F-box protein [Sesamum radiatum]|uniref:F-box protein n=1 Tax=Sesamum radiatum TaxID=300843 RepID=A0AAW2VN14_SESRA